MIDVSVKKEQNARTAKNLVFRIYFHRLRFGLFQNRALNLSKKLNGVEIFQIRAHRQIFDREGAVLKVALLLLFLLDILKN